MSNISLLQQRYINILCSNINERLAEKGSQEKVNKLEDIFDHINELTESIIIYCEEYKYLPLATKRLLAFAVDPFVSITVKEVKWYDNGESCAVSVIVKWSDAPADSAGIEGYARRNYNDIFRDQELPSSERKEKLESVVRGLAESKALTNAGIGLDLICDSLDLEIEKVEKAKTEEILKQKATAKLPDFSKKSEKKQSRAAERAAKRAAASTVEGTQASTPEPTQMPINLETPSSEAVVENVSADEETSDSSISLERALSTVVDIGDYTGHTLKEVLSKNPRNLIWLTNAGSKIAAEALIVIDSNEKLKKLAGR